MEQGYPYIKYPYNEVSLYCANLYGGYPTKIIYLLHNLLTPTTPTTNLPSIQAQTGRGKKRII